DDLGISRVEALPLDDEHRDRDRGHRGQHRAGANNHRRQMPPPGFTAPRRAPPHGNPVGGNWNINDVWRDAMAAGAFDDEDAHGVKDLDDLGGGRSYDNAASGGVSQSDRIAGKAMRILDQRNKRLKARFNGKENIEPGHNNTFSPAARRQQNGNHSRASTGRAVVPSASFRAKPATVNPLHMRLPPPLSSPPAVPMPDIEVDPNAPLPFELANVVLKDSVRFLSRDVNPALSALVLLSAASRPGLGFFTVVIFNRKFCQWPISAWYDYSTGADNLLGVTFQNDGALQGYELYFTGYDNLVEFMATVRSLQAGNYLDQIESASAPASATALAPASNAAVSEAPQAGSPVDVVSVQTMSPGASAAAAPSITSDTTAVASFVISDGVAAATTAEDPHSPSETINGSSQEDTPPEQPAEDEQDTTLVDLEADDLSVVASQHPSEATELLSTLEPYDYDIGTPSARVSLTDIMDTARHLFQFFLMSGTGGRTETVSEMDHMAEGVRVGVLQHIMQDARAQGLSALRIQEIKDMVDGIFAALIATNRKRLVARSKPRRIQYTVEELLSMRGAAVKPPGCFADIPYLPKPGDRARQTSNPNRGMHGATFTRSQALRSANAMRWVLGETVPTEQEPEVSKPNTGKSQATASRAAGPVATSDSGLQSSRWASGAPDIKHANYFTGPRYEKSWSRRSYLEDLAQLDPQAKVTVGAEDVMDFYFPKPSNDGPQVGPAESRAPANGDNQVPALTGSESGAVTPPRTDKIENLRVGMSRLSIWSPTSASARADRGTALSAGSALVASSRVAEPRPPLAGVTQPTASPAVQPSAQPRVRGLAASRHSSGAGPSSSGKFNFHVPGSARK
ncbi:hypothetical protein C8A00DRAFT_17104, partial [Chaetomidium leptoderma]